MKLKIKSKTAALMTVFSMLLTLVPFTAFATDTASTQVNASLLSPDTLPDGRVEVKYSKQFYFDYSKFNNGFMSYSWSVEDGELPPGLELVGQYSTWQPTLSGTPTKAGTYTFTIEGGRTDYINGENVPIVAARKTYTITILPAYPLEISNTSLFNGTESSPYWNHFYEYKSREVTWSMELEDGTALPDGLSIDATSGELNWESPVAGKYNLKITATRESESVSKVLKLIIEPGNGCTHSTATKHERKKATCKEKGLADYWYCNVCEKYLLDENGERETSSDNLDKLYTTSFHSDTNDDGKCDTCDKIMPVFKKVTSEDEITSCGMYLVVSKMGDKYYTLKDVFKTGHAIEAVEIAQNSDGTFSYPKSDRDVMILKTEFAAECGELDAGLPRYSIGTTIGGIPYSISSDDYSGSVYMYSYENSKYGFRISLPEGGTPAIASVYAEYWGGSESTSCGIMTFFEGAKDGNTSHFFSFKTKDSYENDGFYTGNGYEFYDTDSLSTYPIELYKLTYVGEANGQNYFLSDGQSIVTIESEFTVVNSVESGKLSTVGGISEAVKTSYVTSVISGQNQITGDVSAKAYADISVKREESTTDEWGYTSLSSLVYAVVPKLEIKGNSTEESIIQEIDDKCLDGSEMTLSLCVGNMEPRQIIHHKADGTKEYFYSEYSTQAKKGAKTFINDPNYSQKGNFVTFTVDSFSDIEILATAVAEEQSTKTTVSGNKFTVKGSNIDGSIVILALYKEDTGGKLQLVEFKSAKYDGKPLSFTVTSTDYTSTKVMVWESLTNIKPVTQGENVILDANS